MVDETFPPARLEVSKLRARSEHSDMPNGIARVEAQGPEEEQVVVQLHHQQPLALERIEDLLQVRPPQLLGRDRRTP
jgi:hypothetical protein